MSDTFFMNRAIMLSIRARGMTSPNPMVGAVIVKNGKIIAEGTPEQIVINSKSVTGKFLKAEFN